MRRIGNLLRTLRSPWTLLVVLFILAAILIAHHFGAPTAGSYSGDRPPASQPVTPPSAPSTSTAELSTAPGPPTHITIPAVEIDAPIMAVQVKGGVLEPPGLAVVWPDSTARPGDIGSAVLAAHNYVGSKPGTFLPLTKVKTADLVVIGYGDGSSLKFQVTRIASIKKEEVAEDKARNIWSSAGRQLVLITCDPSEALVDGHSPSNIVVWTTLVSPVPSPR